MALRTSISGITIILPKDAKLNKKQLFEKYGDNSPMKKTQAFCDQLHDRIQAANNKLKVEKKVDKIVEDHKEEVKSAVDKAEKKTKKKSKPE